ncbi:MAG: PorV/PorQ family protein [Balneolaceae bacterium]
MKHYLLFFLMTVLISFSHAIAQDTGSGLDFLNIGPSARLLAINEAGTASPIGASAIYINPALLVLEEQSSGEINYTSWISNVNNQYGAVNFLRNNHAFGLGVYSSRADDFEARDRPGPSQGAFSITFLSIAGSFARQFGPVSAGITGQFLREEVFQFRANGFAVNFGLATSFMNDRIRAGISVLNIGEMDELEFESTKLPTNLRIGLHSELIELSTPLRDDLSVLFALDFDYIQPLRDNPSSDFATSSADDPFFNIGLTSTIADLIVLQGGYKFGPTERPVSLGAAFLINPVRINYALVPFRTGFDTVHSIGLQIYF